MKIQTRGLLIALFLGISSSLFAADGWYLMIPPRSEYNKKAEYLNSYKILDSKPLSQWKQQGAYDSATECEDARHNLTMVEQRVYSETSLQYMNAVGAKESPTLLQFQRASVERLNANVFALLGSRCIRSNDPRLKY